MCAVAIHVCINNSDKQLRKKIQLKILCTSFFSSASWICMQMKMEYIHRAQLPPGWNLLLHEVRVHFDSSTNYKQVDYFLNESAWKCWLAEEILSHLIFFDAKLKLACAVRRTFPQDVCMLSIWLSESQRNQGESTKCSVTRVTDDNSSTIGYIQTRRCPSDCTNAIRNGMEWKETKRKRGYCQAVHT